MTSFCFSMGTSCSKAGASNSPSYENLSSKSLRLIFLPGAGDLQQITHKQQVKVPTPIIVTAAKTAKQVTSCSLWNFEQSPCFDQDTNTSKQCLRNYRIFHRLSLETSVSTLFKFQLQRNSTMSTVLC